MSAARREALLRAVSAYRAADSRKDEAASRFGRFLERADPLSRNDPDGHVTASAVAFADVALVDRDGSLARAVARARARLP